MDALTLDRIQVFLAIIDEGSFSKAARKLKRSKPAITDNIQKLEVQIGFPLFDRTVYKATLTEAGHTLLLRARRISEEANAFRDAARRLASGLEAELTIVLDEMFPMKAIDETLRTFTSKFPSTPPRVDVRPHFTTVEMVLNSTCMIGLLPFIFSDIAGMKRFPMLTIDLIPVVATDHPLARLDGPIATHILHQHVQLLLTGRSALTADQGHGVSSGRTWRPTDLGVMHSMLLAGVGWGNMPSHLVEDDIARGRLKVIRPLEFDARGAKLVMGGAYLANRRLGPAAQWMVNHLSGSVDA